MDIRNSIITGEKGLFSTKKYKQNEVLHILSGDIYDKPLRETIHIGNNKHIYDKYGIYLNHSCTPNINIVGDKLVAARDIEIDEELFFNYNDTEINMACPFYDNNILICGRQINHKN
jgi:hypothetical protein